MHSGRNTYQRGAMYIAPKKGKEKLSQRLSSWSEKKDLSRRLRARVIENRRKQHKSYLTPFVGDDEETIFSDIENENEYDAKSEEERDVNVKSEYEYGKVRNVDMRNVSTSDEQKYVERFPESGRDIDNFVEMKDNEHFEEEHLSVFDDQQSVQEEARDLEKTRDLEEEAAAIHLELLRSEEERMRKEQEDLHLSSLTTNTHNYYLTANYGEERERNGFFSSVYNSTPQGNPFRQRFDILKSQISMEKSPATNSQDTDFRKPILNLRRKLSEIRSKHAFIWT